MTNSALPASPNQLTDSPPKSVTIEFTTPSWGTIANNFWKSRATATVGRTTGKKTNVRIHAELRRNANVNRSARRKPTETCKTVTMIA